MAIILTTGKENLLRLILRQLDSNFLLEDDDAEIVSTFLDSAIAVCEENFLHAPNKYCTVLEGGEKKALFNPYNTVQYMVFLYSLAHLIYKQEGGLPVCDKLYCLNKMLNGVDLFYAIELPEHFYAEHPLGSVMGRAKYGDGFVFYQGCTVGGTVDKNTNGIVYPILGDDVWMFANTSILGNCRIGNHVRIGAGAIVKNQNVPDDSLVFGQSPNLIIKSLRK